ncbi:MAG TPA: hypothetical protein VGV69_02715 [Solirubrobacterales bacterium]|nr:hypothetical protein [Solirubrobacterales bacterium]
MIAAKRGRIGARFRGLPMRLRRWSRQVDRVGNRGLERVYPVLLRARHRSLRAARRSAAWLGPRLRPLLAFLFHAVARGERLVRRTCTLSVRAATAASRAIPPGRAAAAVLVAAGACLVASQFVDYRAVEIGQPGYAGLAGDARAPTTDVRTAGEAHAYLLVPIGALAAVLGLAALRRERRRLGLLVAALGLLSLAVIFLVDLPAGLDEGSQTSRFAGASAVLEDGFYAELAAAGGMVLAGLLYYARPCRIRISSSGRAASARRRRPRRRASSQARVARRA